MTIDNQLRFNLLFKHQLAIQATTRRDETRHSSVVEALEGHRRRVGDANVVLPMPPDQDAISVVREKFPNGLTDYEIDTEGM